MATLYHGGLTFGVNLGDWLDDAKIYSRQSDYEGISKTSSEQLRVLARLVNRIVEDVLRENPLLGNAEATLSLKSGEDRIYEYPADLHGVDIFKLQFELSSGLGDAIPVIYRKRNEMRARPDNAVQNVFPSHYDASLTDDGRYLEIFPEPPSSTYVLKMFYRVEHTALTSSNIGTPDAVTVTELPADAHDYVAIRLAERICRISREVGRADELAAEGDMELTRLRRIITGAIGTLAEKPVNDDRVLLAPYGDYYDHA